MYGVKHKTVISILVDTHKGSTFGLGLHLVRVNLDQNDPVEKENNALSSSLTKIKYI